MNIKKEQTNYLTELNPAQRSAVEQTAGPLLIIAGAGAGKTKTIISRIMHIIKQGIEPNKILAITFTNKAAKEMKERIRLALDKEAGLKNTDYLDKPFISTFHSLGVHILKENSRDIGLPRYFSIFDRQDSQKAVKDILLDLGFDPKEHEPAKLLGGISRQKNNLQTVESFRASEYKNNLPGQGELLAQVWTEYEKKLHREKALDFDDLLLKTYFLLKDKPNILAKYQKAWQYIHVDEYQDTNEVQYMIVHLLSQEHKNVCVVGDIDQNIYSWRGADIKNILNFEKDYAQARIILLEENYRSTQNILAVANAIIKKNVNRVEKNLFTKNAEGDKLTVYTGLNEVEEAYFVANKSAELIESGVPPREIAVLYRANFQSRILEEAFLNKNVPYQVLGTKFFDRKEVKDILAFIRASLNPDSLTDIKRIINVPARGLGKVTILKIFSGQRADLPASTKIKVNQFYNLLEKIKEQTQKIRVSEVVRFVIQETGLEREFRDGNEEDRERLENMRELATLAVKYDHLLHGEGVEKLLEDSALATDQDSLDLPNQNQINKEKKIDGVKLMTVHAAKGLEFDYVFITGLEEGLFPHEKFAGKGGADEGKVDTEEERRLFYVALTRARQKIFLTYADRRTIFGSTQHNTASRFLTDIDPEFLEMDQTFEHREKIIYLEL